MVADLEVGKSYKLLNDIIVAKLANEHHDARQSSLHIHKDAIITILEEFDETYSQDRIMHFRTNLGWLCLHGIDLESYKEYLIADENDNLLLLF